MRQAITALADHFRGRGVTKVIGPEARGFMVGVPVALELGAGFIPARKPGKLPRETVSISYELEYGTDTLEDPRTPLSPAIASLSSTTSLPPVVPVAATGELVQNMGAELIGYGCILELLHS